MQDQAAMTSMQKQVQVVLPVIMTAVTSFQPAAIQLYFFTTAITGAVTGWSLRQPAIRRMLRIRHLPTPESQQLYSKVVQGEIDLKSIKGADGKIRYQAPTTVASKRTISSVGINLKPGATLPAHMRAAAAQEVSAEKPKSTWEQIKSTPKNLGEKINKWQDPRDPEVKKKQDAKEKQKRALKKYEEERKRAMSQG